MAGLVVDTHALVWYLLGSPRLSHAKIRTEGSLWKARCAERHSVVIGQKMQALRSASAVSKAMKSGVSWHNRRNRRSELSWRRLSCDSAQVSANERVQRAQLPI